jgi:hypothetical protein
MQIGPPLGKEESESSSTNSQDFGETEEEGSNDSEQTIEVKKEKGPEKRHAVINLLLSEACDLKPILTLLLSL